jgi:hypothetical protein
MQQRMELDGVRRFKPGIAGDAALLAGHSAELKND